jgi:hypothetical protein
MGASSGSEPDPQLRRIAARAHEAGMRVWWTRGYSFVTREPGDVCGVRIAFPAGNATREMDFMIKDAARLEPFKFEHWVLLGDHEAFLDTRTRQIFAAVDLRGVHTFTRIPGVKRNFHAPALGDDGPDLFPAQLTVRRPGSDVALQLQRPCHRELWGMFGNQFTSGLRITGVGSGHDDAMRLLEKIAPAFLLDLDLAYGVVARLRPSYQTAARARSEDDYDQDVFSPAAPAWPARRYLPVPARLYGYGRTMSMAPVLEYLAYYQVIEYFLPKYAHAQQIRQLRKALTAPGFRPDDDTALTHLVEQLTTSARTHRAERTQVCTAIAACLHDDDLRQFLTDYPAAARALADTSRITSVRAIRPQDHGTPLVTQVASRIYDLRCRIVHAKESTDDQTTPLRPYDHEATDLQHDLKLIRFVAQRMLITSAEPTP